MFFPLLRWITKALHSPVAAPLPNSECWGTFDLKTHWREKVGRESDFSDVNAKEKQTTSTLERKANVIFGSFSMFFKTSAPKAKFVALIRLSQWSLLPLLHLLLRSSPRRPNLNFWLQEAQTISKILQAISVPLHAACYFPSCWRQQRGSCCRRSLLRPIRGLTIIARSSAVELQTSSREPRCCGIRCDEESRQGNISNRLCRVNFGKKTGSSFGDDRKH